MNSSRSLTKKEDDMFQKVFIISGLILTLLLLVISISNLIIPASVFDMILEYGIFFIWAWYFVFIFFFLVIKRKKKTKQVSLYTCLYLTNVCSEDCPYCYFRRTNKDLKRRTLNFEQVKQEVAVIKELGVNNVIVIGGTLVGVEYESLVLRTVSWLISEGMVPWLELDNPSAKLLKRLKAAGADHFILFQETYNQELFAKLHENNLVKNNFLQRLEVIDRAVQAGFINIGIGALFGLSPSVDQEISGLVDHAQRLLAKGVNVCVFVPTVKHPAYDLISAQQLDQIITAVRVALPQVSIGLSGREPAELRDRLFLLVDQIGTGGVTNPGGRTVYKDEYEAGNKQFVLADLREPTEITESLKKQGVKVVNNFSWRNENEKEDT